MEQPLRYIEESAPTRGKRRKRRRRCKRHPKDGPHSPDCRGEKITGHSLVRILPPLKPVLDYLHVDGEIFTREQIMNHLTEYIKKKSLFDPEDPRKVYCENDQLALIFGCNEFSTANACELLLRNLQSVHIPAMQKQETQPSKWSTCGTSSCYPSPNINKWNSVSTTDTCSCSESDQQSMSEACSSKYLSPPSKIICKDTGPSKRSHNNSYTGLNHPTSQNSEPFYGIGFTTCGYNSSLPSEDNELSLEEYGRHYKRVCGNATDIVSDTSDDLFFLNETDDDPVVTEREEDRFAEEYEPISFSEEERLMAEIGENEDEGEANSLDTTEDEGEDGGDELDNADSDSEIEEEDKWQCEGCSERNHPMTRRCRSCWTLRKDWCPPTLGRSVSDPVSFRNQKPQTDQASVSDSATTSHDIDQFSEGSGRSKCIMCLKEPPNGCIIHGHTGHQVCCVGCAKRLKEARKPCPVCRKKIHRVIQNFL